MKRRHPVLIAFLTIIVLLVAARVAAPYVIKDQINQGLAEHPDFDGGVNDVDLMLWRGGMRVEGIEVFKPEVSAKTPLFAARAIEVFVRWPAILRGAVITDVTVAAPQIELVSSSASDAKRDAKAIERDAEPPSDIDELIRTTPIKIDRFLVVDGSLRFLRQDAQPPIDVRLTNVRLEMRNLTNSQKVSDTLVARLDMSAKAQGEGDLNVGMSINPNAHPADFDLKARLIGLPATSLNAFSKEYANFDFERGAIDVVTELRVKDGHAKGYVKPLLRNIEVHAKEDRTRDDDNLLKRAWEALVGAAETAVENPLRIQSGTRIPIDGPVNAPATDTFAAVVAVLRNAYVQALLPRFENVSH